MSQLGDVYEGEWDKDEIKGKGTFKFMNGDSYTGSFLKGIRNGVGKYTYANGDLY